MKKKTIIIILLSVLTVLLAGIYFVFASFNGSVIKKMIMTSKVKAYVEENFPSQPLKVEFCKYDFKCFGYFCNVQSECSEDTGFIVYEDAGGNLTDDYELRVIQKENTKSRLSMELDDYAEEYLKEVFPHRTSLVICDFCEYSGAENFELDMPFDADTLSIPATLTVWVETAGEKPTWEELAERLRELESLSELPFVEYYSVCIQNKYIEEDGELIPADFSSEVCAYDVPRYVITGDGLEDYLKDVKAEQDAELEAISRGEHPKK